MLYLKTILKKQEYVNSQPNTRLQVERLIRHILKFKELNDKSKIQMSTKPSQRLKIYWTFKYQIETKLNDWIQNHAVNQIKIQKWIKKKKC